MTKDQLTQAIREAIDYREISWRATEYSGGVIVIDTTEGGGFVIEAKELAPPACLRAQAQREAKDRNPPPFGERIDLVISPVAAGALAAPPFDDDGIPF